MTQQGSSPQARLGLLAELARSAQLVWRLVRDPRVATAPKILIPGLVGAYILWPIDLLADVIPVLGQVDDVLLLVLGVRLFIQLCPADIVQQHRAALADRGATPPPPDDTPQDDVVDAEYRVIE